MAEPITDRQLLCYMKKAKVIWVVLWLGALVLVGSSFFRRGVRPDQAPPSPRPTAVNQLTEQKSIPGPVFRGIQLSPLQRLQNFLRTHVQPPVDMRLVVSGPTGTPVVVGYKIDGSSRQTLLRGIVPTNWVIRARRRVDAAVKNVGNTNVYLGCSVFRASQPFSWRSPPPDFFCPPGYGFRAEDGWGSPGQVWHRGDTLMPTDWPVTLPPGMTEQQAKTHDFKHDWAELQLRQAYARLTENAEDLDLLMEIARLSWGLTNFPAAEDAYQRFFALKCTNSAFLNRAIHSYLNHGGTNVQRAYELALTVRAKQPWDPDVADTLAWIQLKRGYYQQAVDLLTSAGRPLPGNVEVSFHLGLAHYMLLQEDRARQDFQIFMQDKSGLPGRAEEEAEAKNCLGILNSKAIPPSRATLSMLRTRLVQTSDDPVALDRLGQRYEPSDANGNPSADPLMLKALGVSDYRRGDYSQAAHHLAECVKSRTTDGVAFLYLGLARNHLQQTNECVEALRSAKSLTLKAAQLEEADAVLRSLSQN